jgi:hypothetical protein
VLFRSFTFEDLRKPGNAFERLIDRQKAVQEHADQWWRDPDWHRLYVYLLGRCLNKITGSRGLKLDKERHRYYFATAEPGRPLQVRYRPLNMNASQVSVVWQPRRESTGEPYGYWLHRAVRLRFYRVSGSDWILALRPEFHVTKDGQQEYNSADVGAKVTHKKARMYNRDLLVEVNFWRNYLSDGQPRIVYKCDGQALVIATTLLQSKVTWPGVPDDTIEFRNVQIPETLFTLQESDALQAEDFGDEEEWPEEGGADDSSQA